MQLSPNTVKPLLNVLFLYVDSSVMYLELYKYIICRKCILHACQTCQRCGDSNKTGIPGAGGGSFPRPQQISYFGQEFGREFGRNFNRFLSIYRFKMHQKIPLQHFCHLKNIYMFSKSVKIVNLGAAKGISILLTKFLINKLTEFIPIYALMQF